MQQKIINEPTIFEAEVTFLVHPKTFVGTFIREDETPTVQNVTVWKANNIAPNNITNFDDGQEGQTIKILGDGQTTVVYSTTIKTNTGIDKLLDADKMYTFTYVNSTWIEDA